MTTPSPERKPFIVAAAQLCSTNDVTANLAVCRKLAADAAERGAEMFALPECFAFIGRTLGDRLPVAERLDRPGPIVEEVRDMARKHRMWVVAGGMPEVSGVPQKTYNTCLVVDPDGETRAVYRKIHMFDVKIPGRAELCESSSTAAGDDVVVAQTPFARLGLSICYDVRFPELYRVLAVERGAEVLMVPAAFTAHTGAAHWHTLLRARAIENQCFVVAAAQHGKHGPVRESYGHTLIIDPWGEVMAEVQEGDGLAVAEIDPAVLTRVREQMPCHSHRVLGARPE
ncbi:MAG TPA: carbon-nitrogen hydrolase family protein [Kofleriaceae bacterium]|nr:carbon-nitrogen hydrolase family protein [Kofleriaceae bacterium]